MYSKKSVLLLDMNGTFMFGEDNFAKSEDYSKYYHEIGGVLPSTEINQIIQSIYYYLDTRYPDENFRHMFPSVETALKAVVNSELAEEEISKVIHTFSHHEIGHIPTEYIEVLYKLSKKFQLAVVIDIWSPKQLWMHLFEKLGISELFSASSFSSDHGMVKPSPKPYQLVMKQLSVSKDRCLVIGDSIRRDLGAANSAGIDCVLVGGSRHVNAVGYYENLLEFSAKS
jgi:HAD superfamily hydrolase (TIGR01549 family)